MHETKKLAEVFKTVGLPPYTYVKPAHYGEVRTDVEQPGKHLLIEGPSGIGKTCVIYKVFEELSGRLKAITYTSLVGTPTTGSVLRFFWGRRKPAALHPHHLL